MPSVHRRAARLAAIVVAAVNIVVALTALAVHAHAATTNGISSTAPATDINSMFLTGLFLILAGLATGLAWLLWPRFVNRGLRHHGLHHGHLSHGWRA